MSIKVLDPKVVSQIAAGEVVERPASVVKELIENSLDAGSTQIGVDVGGGTTLIRVIDDGVGISSDEVELAFQRHATSKLSSLDDLQRIKSLGFRGEALPSIAAVAEVEMVTCAEGENGGTFIRLADGEVVEKQGRGRSRGTTITVRNLFRKVPARLKFLKSPATENSHIANVVSQYAFSYPEVRFSLIIDGKESLRTPGSGRLMDSVIAVYGLDTAQSMIEIGGEKEWEGNSREAGIRVDGMVGSPTISRANRNFLSFFVNRRWVSSRLLSWAVEEAYHGLLMTGKHPVAIINIQIPTAEVDVNIHPAKSEVKFRDEKAVFGAVQKTVRQTLIKSTPVPRMEDAIVRYGATPPRQGEMVWTPSAQGQSQEASASVAQQIPFSTLPVLRVLGQMQKSYIVAEGPDGLYLIDQHAAHERIRFEEIQRQRSGKGVEVQGLLTPATFEVSPRQDAVLKSHFRDLADFGFSLESFGERTYLVRTVPAMLKDSDWPGMLREMLDGAIGAEWSERMMISLACHSAVRAGQVLSDTEMRELVDKLAEATLPHSCPHGRPTMLHISSEKLRKDFGRT